MKPSRARSAGALVALLFLSPLFPPAPAEPDVPAAKEVWKMTPEQASAFARLALKGIRKEYPNKPADVLNSEKDVQVPRAVRLALVGPRPLDAGAAAAPVPGAARGAEHPHCPGGTPDGEKPPGRGRL